MSLAPLKELLVLSVVDAHPMHGYALADALGAGLGPSLGLTKPTIYAILRRLEGRAMIEADKERDGRRPERAVFRLTTAGRDGLRALQSKVAADAPPALAPLGVLLALFDGLEPDLRGPALARLRADWEARLAELAVMAEHHDGFAGAALKLLQAQVALEIETLERLGG